VIDRSKPDLVIRESMEYGGCIAAELRGIPHASVAGNGMSALDSPEVHYFPGNRRVVAEPLARHRAAVGLPSDPDNLMPFRSLHMCFAPKSWDGVDAPAPRNSEYFRHVDAVPPGTELPAWVSELDRSRPTVFASLGTVFNKTPGLLEAIVAGVAAQDVNLVVAIGRDVDPARFGQQPPNVRLEPYVPQALLLPHCDAFITHAGFNSAKESLSAGVPMVAVPITADQPYCAARLAALGAAKAVGADERSPEAIAAALGDVLHDGGYRRAAQSLQQEMRALPGPDRVVGRLEALARNSVPSASRA